MCEFVNALTSGEHPVVVVGGSVRASESWRRLTDAGHVFIRFTNTGNGKNLGLRCGPGKTRALDANFAEGIGFTRGERNGTLDGVPVTVVADVEVGFKVSGAREVRLDDDSPSRRGLVRGYALVGSLVFSQEVTRIWRRYGDARRGIGWLNLDNASAMLTGPALGEVPYVVHVRGGVRWARNALGGLLLKSDRNDPRPQFIEVRFRKDANRTGQ